MPKNNLKITIEKASAEFADAIIKAVKGASLQELMEIQKTTTAAKKRGKKPGRKKQGPKPKKKTARKKPGPKTKKKTARKKPGPKPGKKTAAKPKKKAVKKTKRLSPAQKAGVQNKIHAYLKKNPMSSRGKVAKAMRMPTGKIGLYLRELKKAGKVKSNGQKAATKYSVMGK